MDKITIEEYEKACETVQRFEYQINPTIQVSVTYKASICATVRVPAKWSIDRIKEELAEGFHDFSLEDTPDTELLEIEELIVSGKVIPL